MADNFQDLLKSLKVEIDPEEVEESIKNLQEKYKRMDNANANGNANGNANAHASRLE